MGSVSLRDRQGKGRRFFPAARIRPRGDRVRSAWSGVAFTTRFSLGTFERWLPRWAQGIGSEDFRVRRVLRVLPLVTPRAGKTWNAAPSWPSASVIACSGGHHETFPSETS